MSSSVNVEITGLEDLAGDIDKAALLAPKEFQKGMKKITKKFMDDLKDEAANTYQTTENITTGFKMSPVNVAKDQLYSYFMPEAKGNQGHAWHLQENGYELVKPTWKSCAKAIRYKDGGRTIRFVPGHHLVEKVLPSFEEYMDFETLALVDKILEENDL